MRSRQLFCSLLVIANFVAWGVLSLQQTTTAAPPAGQPPFANSVDQRDEMIRELREIKSLLKEQNALLAGGTPKAAPAPSR